MSFDLTLGFFIDLALIARIVGAAFRIDAGEENDLLAVGRNQNPAGLGRELGDRMRVRSVGVHCPHLG